MYSHRSSTGPVDLAFTDRHDGVSAAPFDSLNLALVGDDDEVARRHNLALVLDDFAPGARVAEMEQVHGRRVVTTPGGRPRERCDALVTDQPDVAWARGAVIDLDLPSGTDLNVDGEVVRAARPERATVHAHAFELVVPGLLGSRSALV